MGSVGDDAHRQWYIAAVAVEVASHVDAKRYFDAFDEWQTAVETIVTKANDSFDVLMEGPDAVDGEVDYYDESSACAEEIIKETIR